MSEVGLQKLKVNINKKKKKSKWILNGFEEQLRNRGIDVNAYDFEDEEVRESQAPSTPSGIDISSVLVALVEKIQVISKLEEMLDSFSKGVTSIEEVVSSFEKTIDTKVINLEKSWRGKPVMLEEKVNNKQSQRTCIRRYRQDRSTLLLW